MDKQRKWTGWLLISVIVLVAGAALVMTTLADSRPDPYSGTQTPQTTNTPSVAPQSTTQPARGSSLTANASHIGYAGPVLVRLTLDENGAVAALDIGGARFQETEGLGGKVREEAFIQSFIGKTPPFTIGEDVDAIAGATLSSTAAVDAINEAALFIAQMQSDSN